MVSHLVQHLGVEGCGGASCGVDALGQAVEEQHVDVMAILADAGVMDTGTALVTSAKFGREASVKFLLQQRSGENSGGRAYVNTCDKPYGETPLLFAVGYRGCCSPRVVRLLVDAGAETTSIVRVRPRRGINVVLWHDTPLAVTSRSIQEKTVYRKVATEDQLNRLEAIHRLLLRVEAVHAVSWLWPGGASSITHAVIRTTTTSTTGTPLSRMLLILRRRARSPRVLLAPLFRRAMMLWWAVVLLLLYFWADATSHGF